MTSVEQIAVASGMVAEQERCSTAAAILILRARAEECGDTLVRVAVLVIGRHETGLRRDGL